MTNKLKLSITQLEDRTCLSTTGVSVGVPLPPLPPPPPPAPVVVVIIKPPVTGMGNVVATTLARA